MLTSTLISRVLAEGGFDVERSQVLTWLDLRNKEAIARSHYRRDIYSFPETQVGVAVYGLPGEVIELEELKVGEVPYERVGTRDMWDLVAGNKVLVGSPGGVFAPTFDHSGDAEIQLWPVPEAVERMEGLVALVAPALVDDNSLSSIIPEDMHNALLSGAVADGMVLLDEDVQGAQVHLQRFEAMVAELQARANSRVGGDRPAQIQVRGYHWD